MRVAMIELDGRVGPAVVLPEGGFVDLAGRGLPWRDVEELIEAGDEGLRDAESVAGSGGPGIDSARLLCPLSRPEKIMCIGKNYADHCRELGSALPEMPVLFAKYRNALAGPGEEIRLPSASKMVDYEAELAVVIGARCKDISPEEALSFVFGYTCANDLTMRDAQKADGQWTRAKSPDSFCPLGPWIVTADEIADPHRLSIRLTLNGKLMQESNTEQMVFGVAELVSYLSSTMTLQPGDLLLTGTPPGVGAGRDPQVFLKKGDRVSVELEGIGTLENRMV
jgi:2-keto-4-pentenoate hydratase/2-oxohepta-3-ene-1,7-dioic acid hydratase in catechol pathway